MAAEVEAVALELHGLGDAPYRALGLDHGGATVAQREHVGRREPGGPRAEYRDSQVRGGGRVDHGRDSMGI